MVIHDALHDMYMYREEISHPSMIYVSSSFILCATCSQYVSLRMERIQTTRSSVASQPGRARPAPASTNDEHLQQDTLRKGKIEAEGDATELVAPRRSIPDLDLSVNIGILIARVGGWVREREREGC